jgi:hypothetical protein
LLQYSTKKIKKEAFLLAFKVAFKKLIIKENICAGFRGARLVLYNLEVVILKLNNVTGKRNAQVSETPTSTPNQPLHLNILTPY